MKSEQIKKSRKKRGMTLVEVIISIAVMAVLTLLLTTIGVTIDKYRQDTKARNDRITIEGPSAELQSRDTPTSSNMGKQIDEDFKISVQRSGGSAVEVSGKLYCTSDELTDTGAVDSENVPIYEGDTNGHFKFVYIDPNSTPGP